MSGDCALTSIAVEPGDPAAPEVRALIEALDAQMASLYPSESNHLLPVETLRQPGVTFLVARLGERVVGCGAFVDQDGAYAEVKRMYVHPGSRGLRIGWRLLEELERRARAAGLPLARLETGISQPEALGLYERAGYRRRGPFGNYAEDPLSVFMEKHLA
jgi:putative acetyltransferase